MIEQTDCVIFSYHNLIYEIVVFDIIIIIIN